MSYSRVEKRAGEVMKVFLKILILGAGLLVSSSGLAFSQHAHGGGSSQQVPQSGNPTIHRAYCPTATFDEKGRLWTAWVFGDYLYVNRSDDFGKTFSNPVRVNRHPERIAVNGENRPKIVVGKNGNVFVSYSQSFERRFTGQVRFARSINGGRSFSDPITINDDRDTAGHGFDVLGIADDGTIYMAWLDGREKVKSGQGEDRYQGSSVYYTYSTDGGSTFRPNKKIMDHVCECCRLSMTFDRKGMPLIMVRAIFGDNIRDHALIRFISRDDFQMPQRITFNSGQLDGCPHHGPSLILDQEGKAHFTWFSIADTLQQICFGSDGERSNVSGDAQPFIVPDPNGKHAFLLAQGSKFFLVWKSHDAHGTNVKLMTLDDERKEWTKPTSIASSKGESDHPFLLSYNNIIFLSWKNSEGYTLSPLLTPEHSSR